MDTSQSGKTQTQSEVQLFEQTSFLSTLTLFYIPRYNQVCKPLNVIQTWRPKWKKKNVETIKQGQKHNRDKNTRFPSKDCHQGRQCSFTVCQYEQSFSRATPAKASTLKMTCNGRRGLKLNMPSRGSDQGSQMEQCWHQRRNFPVLSSK